MVWVVALSDADLSTRALTPGFPVKAFGVYQDLIGGEALVCHPKTFQRLPVRSSS